MNNFEKYKEDYKKLKALGKYKMMEAVVERED